MYITIKAEQKSEPQTVEISSFERFLKANAAAIAAAGALAAAVAVQTQAGTILAEPAVSNHLTEDMHLR